MPSRFPALFISHGAPTFALEPGAAGATLACIGRHMQAPKAIVIVSAHWITPGQICMTGAAQLETLYDFHGFPAALYALRYPAPGQPALAYRLATTLHHAGWHTQIDATRGLDHGAWVPLLHLFPQARIPVVQMSLPAADGTETAWRLGRALAHLRDEGVLVIGSGSLTHNLADLRQPGSHVEKYAQAFIDWVRSHVSTMDHATMRNYRMQAPAVQCVHPTEEHFLPLLVAMGAAHQETVTSIVDGGVEYGVLSMDTYVFGEIPT